MAGDPSVTVRFPTGVLFDVMMRGGPLPARRFPYLIACGLIGDPVPPVITSGGAQ